MTIKPELLELFASIATAVLAVVVYVGPFRRGADAKAGRITRYGKIAIVFSVALIAFSIFKYSIHSDDADKKTVFQELRLILWDTRPVALADNGSSQEPSVPAPAVAPKSTLTSKQSGTTQSSAYSSPEEQRAADLLKSKALEIREFWISFRANLKDLRQPHFEECLKQKQGAGYSSIVASVCTDSLPKTYFSAFNGQLFFVSAARSSSKADYVASSDLWFGINTTSINDGGLDLLASGARDYLEVDIVAGVSDKNKIDVYSRTLNIQTLYDLLGATAFFTANQQGPNSFDGPVKIVQFVCILSQNKTNITIPPKYFKRVDNRKGYGAVWVIEFPKEPMALLKCLGLAQ